MARAHVNASIDTPHVDVLVDLGHPLLNRVVDGFVKVGGVGALHAASQDTYKFLLQGIVLPMVRSAVYIASRVLQ